MNKLNKVINILVNCGYLVHKHLKLQHLKSKCVYTLSLYILKNSCFESRK